MFEFETKNKSLNILNLHAFYIHVACMVCRVMLI